MKSVLSFFSEDIKSYTANVLLSAGLGAAGAGAINAISGTDRYSVPKSALVSGGLGAAINIGDLTTPSIKKEKKIVKKPNKKEQIETV